MVALVATWAKGVVMIARGLGASVDKSDAVAEFVGNELKSHDVAAPGSVALVFAFAVQFGLVAVDLAHEPS